MRLIATSDLHGHLPEIPPADVLVIAGDIIPVLGCYHPSWPGWKVHCFQWLHTVYVPWLERAPVSAIVQIWGNHDHWAEEDVYDIPWPDRVHSLTNASCVIDGVTFYGVPQQPVFYDWAFNEPDDPEHLGRRWAAVDPATTVLVTHGPPRGVTDAVGPRRAGSVTQRDWLLGNGPRPRVVICGHIHRGGQTGTLGQTTIYNCAHVDDKYQPCCTPRTIIL